MTFEKGQGTIKSSGGRDEAPTGEGWRYWSATPGTPLTEMNERVLAHALLFGRKQAAFRLERNINTINRHLDDVFIRLQVTTVVAAAVKMGWLLIPPGLIDPEGSPGAVEPGVGAR